MHFVRMKLRYTDDLLIVSCRLIFSIDLTGLLVTFDKTIVDGSPLVALFR